MPLASGVVRRGVVALAGEHVVENVRAVRFDGVDERPEQFAFLGGEAVFVGRHSGGVEAGELDELADTALVDRLDSVLGGPDVVGQPADLGRVERVVGRRGRALALGAEFLDERAHLGVELLAEMLEAVLLTLLAPR